MRRRKEGKVTKKARDEREKRVNKGEKREKKKRKKKEKKKKKKKKNPSFLHFHMSLLSYLFLFSSSPPAAALTLSPLFLRYREPVLGTIFHVVEEYSHRWKKVAPQRQCFLIVHNKLANPPNLDLKRGSRRTRGKQRDVNERERERKNKRGEREREREREK